MLWVTIMVVNLLSETILAVSSSTKAAVFGSSAAVCSSSSKMREGCSDAINRLTAWRWPPDNRPMRSVRRFSRPRLRMDSLARNSSRILRLMAKPKPRRLPRAIASAMFSSIVSASQVPAIGSWNTRATIPARSQACFFVTSTPSISMLPESTSRSPEIALRKVDLPAPLEPITATNCPVGISRSRPRKAGFSIGVPGLNVIFRSLAFNISGSSLQQFQLALAHRQHQRQHHQNCRDQIQVLCLQADEFTVERQGNEKAIQNRAEDHGQRGPDQTTRRQNVFAD